MQNAQPKLEYAVLSSEVFDSASASKNGLSAMLPNM